MNAFLPGTLNSPGPAGKQMNCLPGINAVYTGRFSAASAAFQSSGAQWTCLARRPISEGEPMTRLSDRAVVLLTVGAFLAVVVGVAVIGVILAG